MIIGIGFSPAFLGFPMPCVLSITLSLIAKSKCSFITLIHSSSVFSCFFSRIACGSKQSHLEYCSCFSTAPARSVTFCGNLETFLSSYLWFFLSFLSCLYVSNVLVTKSTALLRSCWWLSPIKYICYLSVNKSMSLDLLEFQLPSFGFSDASASFELCKSFFFFFWTIIEKSCNILILLKSQLKYVKHFK